MSTSDQHCHSLFLSSHLDDAVLSCALRLLKECGEGKKVFVASIFSQAIKLLPGLDLYKGRRAEDERALNILGVKSPLWLDFRDAPFRNLFYTSFRSIILGKHSKDDAWAERIAKSVASLCRELQPQTIFIPLAIGTHIDHRLTHHIWCTLPSSVNIIFYEDRPYVFVPYSLECRLIDIGAEAPLPSLPVSLVDKPTALGAFAKGLKEIPMYKNVLTSKRDRFRYLLWARRKMTPPQEANLKVESEIITTTNTEEVTQIEKAISAYKSQLPILYKNLDTFRQVSALYTNTFTPNSLYAERYWKLLR
jgi:LmbE family N-acetylglucosaminyl deacetylase